MRPRESAGDRALRRRRQHRRRFSSDDLRPTSASSTQFAQGHVPRRRLSHAARPRGPDRAHRHDARAPRAARRRRRSLTGALDRVRVVPVERRRRVPRAAAAPSSISTSALRWEDLSRLQALRRARLRRARSPPRTSPSGPQRPRGFHESFAMWAGVEQVETHTSERLRVRRARRLRDRRRSTTTGPSPLTIAPTSFTLDIGAQIRLAPSSCVQLTYGLQYFPPVHVTDSAFDPRDRLDVHRHRASTTRRAACAAVRNGYAIPTAAGDYDRIAARAAARLCAMSSDVVVYGARGLVGRRVCADSSRRRALAIAGRRARDALAATRGRGDRVALDPRRCGRSPARGRRQLRRAARASSASRCSSRRSPRARTTSTSAASRRTLHELYERHDSTARRAGPRRRCRAARVDCMLGDLAAAWAARARVRRRRRRRRRCAASRRRGSPRTARSTRSRSATCSTTSCCRRAASARCSARSARAALRVARDRWEAGAPGRAAPRQRRARVRRRARRGRVPRRRRRSPIPRHVAARARRRHSSRRRARGSRRGRDAPARARAAARAAARDRAARAVHTARGRIRAHALRGRRAGAPRLLGGAGRRARRTTSIRRARAIAAWVARALVARDGRTGRHARAGRAVPPRSRAAERLRRRPSSRSNRASAERAINDR